MFRFLSPDREAGRCILYLRLVAREPFLVDMKYRLFDSKHQISSSSILTVPLMLPVLLLLTMHYQYLSLVPRGLEHLVLRQLGDGKILSHNQEAAIDRVRLKLQQKNTKIGTAADDRSNLAIGYDESNEIWTMAGEDVGTAWVLHNSRQKRCLGPTVIMAGCWERLALSSELSLEDTTRVIRDALQKGYYFDEALQVWKVHVQQHWKVELNEPLSFRISCFRESNKSYGYKRVELIQSLADDIVKYDWNVSMKDYDLEIVIFVKANILVIGFATEPYNQLRSRSFSGNVLPADVLEPRALGNFGDIVRLRPSTAHTLLYLADLQHGESLLDPCCGIGTIPVEASVSFPGVQAFGGDLIIENEDYQSPIRDYLERAKSMELKSSTPTLFAWDASSLPLRDASVDVIVSDLPFGQKCLSASKLSQLLPLILSECARVLNPETGRMVLLCGSYAPVINALTETPNLWQLPCSSVFPVNIGGHIAWVIHVKRTTNAFEPLANYRERTKKLTARRDHVARQKKARTQL